MYTENNMHYKKKFASKLMNHPVYLIIHQLILPGIQFISRILTGYFIGALIHFVPFILHDVRKMCGNCLQAMVLQETHKHINFLESILTSLLAEKGDYVIHVHALHHACMLS